MALEPSPAQKHAALLWGHQLKREIAVVNKNYAQIRNSLAEQNNRRLVVEATTNEKLAAFDRDIRDINEQGLQGRLRDLEQSVETRLSNVHAANASMAMRVDALEKDGNAERSELADKGEALLRRVTEAENGLKLYRQNLEKLHRQPNETQLDMITAELKRLRGLVSSGGEQMQLLQESLDALQASNEELHRANEQLGEDLGRLRAERIINERSGSVRKAPEKRPLASKRAVAAAEETDELHAGSIPDVPGRVTKNQKQPHSQKWDAQGALHNASLSSAEKRPRKQSKTHHRGSIAVEQGTSTSPATTSSLGTRISSHPSKWTQEEINRVERSIVRRGKGWVEWAEAADATSDSEEKSLNANKQLDVLDDASTQRLTRRARATQLGDQRQQLSQSSEPPSKSAEKSTRASKPGPASTSAAPQQRPGKLPATRKSYPKLPSSPIEPNPEPKSRSARKHVSDSCSPDPKSEVEYEIASSPVVRRRLIEQSSNDVFVFEDA